MIDSFRDAFRLPDLKRRILFTLGVLLAFRLGAHIPTPGIDPEAMARKGAAARMLAPAPASRIRRRPVYAIRECMLSPGTNGRFGR